MFWSLFQLIKFSYLSLPQLNSMNVFLMTIDFHQLLIRKLTCMLPSKRRKYEYSIYKQFHIILFQFSIRTRILSQISNIYSLIKNYILTHYTSHFTSFKKNDSYKETSCQHRGKSWCFFILTSVNEKDSKLKNQALTTIVGKFSEALVCWKIHQLISNCRYNYRSWWVGSSANECKKQHLFISTIFSA